MRAPLDVSPGSSVPAESTILAGFQRFTVPSTSPPAIRPNWTDAAGQREAAGEAGSRLTGSSPLSVPDGLQASLWKRSLVATAPPASGSSRVAESARSTLNT